MEPKELKELMKQIKREQKEVSRSKEAAQKYLRELGILTAGGKIKRAFMPVQ